MDQEPDDRVVDDRPLQDVVPDARALARSIALFHETHGTGATVPSATPISELIALGQQDEAAKTAGSHLREASDMIRVSEPFLSASLLDLAEWVDPEKSSPLAVREGGSPIEAVDAEFTFGRQAEIRWWKGARAAYGFALILLLALIILAMLLYRQHVRNATARELIRWQDAANGGMSIIPMAKLDQDGKPQFGSSYHVTGDAKYPLYACCIPDSTRIPSAIVEYDPRAEHWPEVPECIQSFGLADDGFTLDINPEFEGRILLFNDFSMSLERLSGEVVVVGPLYSELHVPPFSFLGRDAVMPNPVRVFGTIPLQEASAHLDGGFFSDVESNALLPEGCDFLFIEASREGPLYFSWAVAENSIQSSWYQYTPKIPWNTYDDTWPIQLIASGEATMKSDKNGLVVVRKGFSIALRKDFVGKVRLVGRIPNTMAIQFGSLNVDLNKESIRNSD
jgi:hypothetical protein